MNKKSSYMLICLILSIITTISFAYAYFSSVVKGEGKENVVTSGSLSIEYVDGQEIILNDAYPGDSISKTVTVTNTGTFDANYDIMYKDLINEFINDELVVSYTCKSYKDYSTNKTESGTCNSLTETPVPYSENTSEDTLSEEININVGMTHEYKITFTFKEMNNLQNYNKGKHFSTNLNVGKAESDVQIALKLNGQTVSELPSDGVYKLASYECKNGSLITWNSIKESYLIEGKTKDNCTLEFTEADTLGAKILMDNPTIKDDSADLFANAADEASESGLFRTTQLDRNEDTNGDGIGEEVLYFRGVVENNYVIFADYCWRIVRTNESGKSIKLRYAGELNGTECYLTGTDVKINNTTYAFNSTMSDAKYLQYVYDTSVSSNAKTQIETWYTSKIESQGESITNLIIDEPYCNDTTHDPINSINNIYYSGYNRTYSSSAKTAQYKCPEASDKYSVNSSNGNGKLGKPIALLTIDEARYAGAVGGDNNTTFYLNTGADTWTMSPGQINSSGNVSIMYLRSGSYINTAYVSHLKGLLPVISISTEAIVADGTSGTYNNPYIIVPEQ